MTDGAACGSCCFTRPTGSFCFPESRCCWSGLGLVFWLFPGPRHLGHVTFDVHTMLFGMIFALLGAQVMAIGLFAKVFSYSERFSQQRSLERWLHRVKLEHGLLIGGILTLSRCRRRVLAVVGVGRQRLWSLRSNALGDLFLTLVVPRSADYLFVVLHQHAGNQPRHVHWRL